MQINVIMQIMAGRTAMQIQAMGSTPESTLASSGSQMDPEPFEVAGHREAPSTITSPSPHGKATVSVHRAETTR